ncbi:MAG: hypothetical protein HYZ18_03880 [Pseudogulbenkiania sp.]|nr:hypothetical protein [Pseudogulbenkiania sp.]
MTLLRKHLPLLCGLLAALWLFFASAGLLGACFGPHGVGQMPAAAGMKHLGLAGHGHDPVRSDAARLHEAGEWLVCAKQCVGELGGVLKPAAPDFGLIAVLAFVVFSLLRLPLPLAAPLTRYSIGRYAVVVGTPPPTIRFHRFNN